MSTILEIYLPCIFLDIPPGSGIYSFYLRVRKYFKLSSTKIFLFQNSSASSLTKLNNSSSSYHGSQDLFESRSHATENRMMTSSSMGGQQRTGSSMGGLQVMGGQHRIVKGSTDYFEQSKIVTKSTTGGKSKTYG